MKKKQTTPKTVVNNKAKFLILITVCEMYVFTSQDNISATSLRGVTQGITCSHSTFLLVSHNRPEPNGVKPFHLTLHEGKTNTKNYLQMLFDSDLLSSSSGCTLSTCTRQHEEDLLPLSWGPF